jgi:hypothetical protein
MFSTNPLRNFSICLCYQNVIYTLRTERKNKLKKPGDLSETFYVGERKVINSLENCQCSPVRPYCRSVMKMEMFAEDVLNGDGGSLK